MCACAYGNRHASRRVLDGTEGMQKRPFLHGGKPRVEIFPLENDTNNAYVADSTQRATLPPANPTGSNHISSHQFSFRR